MSFLLNVARRGAGLAPIATTTSSAVAPAEPLVLAREHAGDGFVELRADVVPPGLNAPAGPISVAPPDGGDVRDASTSAEVAVPRDVRTCDVVAAAARCRRRARW
jgi:hypothetical protein